MILYCSAQSRLPPPGAGLRMAAGQSQTSIVGALVAVAHRGRAAVNRLAAHPSARLTTLHHDSDLKANSSLTESDIRPGEADAAEAVGESKPEPEAGLVAEPEEGPGPAEGAGLAAAGSSSAAAAEGTAAPAPAAARPASVRGTPAAGLKAITEEASVAVSSGSFPGPPPEDVDAAGAPPPSAPVSIPAPRQPAGRSSQHGLQHDPAGSGSVRSVHLSSVRTMSSPFDVPHSPPSAANSFLSPFSSASGSGAVPAVTPAAQPQVVLSKGAEAPAAAPAAAAGGGRQMVRAADGPIVY